MEKYPHPGKSQRSNQFLRREINLTLGTIGPLVSHLLCAKFLNPLYVTPFMITLLIQDFYQKSNLVSVKGDPVLLNYLSLSMNG